jgi:hypothetical protein
MKPNKIVVPAATAHCALQTGVAPIPAAMQPPGALIEPCAPAHDLRAKLAELEKTRAMQGVHTPSCLVEQYEQEIASTRKTIYETRSPGARLDGLQGVVTRSEKRLRAAEAAVA